MQQLRDIWGLILFACNCFWPGVVWSFIIMVVIKAWIQYVMYDAYPCRGNIL